MPKSFKFSQETKDKISNANRGKKRTLETRIKISKAKKGHIPWNKGKKHSEETKRKISLVKKGNNNNNWKGGKKKGSGGYIFIYSPNHPYTRQNYVFEHRLVIEKQIGRYLKPKEIGHHIGEIDDNRPCMLMAFASDSAHHRFHYNPDNVKPEEIIFDGRNHFTSTNANSTS